MCSNEDYFNVLVAQVTVTIQHQVCKAISCSKNIFLLSRLATGYHKEEVDRARHSASTTPRDCTTPRDYTTLLYAVKKQRACKIVFCAACRAGLKKDRRRDHNARTHAPMQHARTHLQTYNGHTQRNTHAYTHVRTHAQTHTHTHTHQITNTNMRTTHARTQYEVWMAGTQSQYLFLKS